MSQSYGAITVRHKISKEIIQIKFERFNSEIHEKLSDPFTMHNDKKVDYSKPIEIMTGNPVEDMILNQEAKKNQEALDVIEASIQEQEKALEKVEEKPQNEITDEKEEFDHTIDLSIEQLNDLTRSQLMKYVKYRGWTYSNTSTKVELLAEIAQRLNTI